MPISDHDEPTDELSLAELLRPIGTARKFIWRTTAVLTLVAALIGGAYLVWQPSRWTAAIGFRPTFDGAEHGTYPNQLEFSPTDIVAPSVADSVFDKNQLQDYCSREAFRAGLTVQQTSSTLQLLDLDYQARLADTRLSVVERQQLSDEYAARRGAVPVQYRLVFIRPPECSRLPAQVAYKGLRDMLQTWAEESESRRGVLKLRRSVLTPAIFDQNAGPSRSLLVRADLIRTALMRVLANIREVETLPGAELVRLPSDGSSLVEVRARIEDLVQAQLDPLIAIAGRSLGRGSIARVEIAWVEQALRASVSEHKIAQEKADAYTNALREYSGVSTTPPAGAVASQRTQNPTDVQALTPQIEGTFIDRIVGMSAANTTFRQDITRSMVTASVAAVSLSGTVEHYRQLLESLRAPQGASLPPAEVAQRLDSVTAAGKELTRHFNAIYDEFSRVSLRAGPSMYRIEDPVSSTTLRAFGPRDYAMLVLGVLVVMPIVLALGVLIRDRWRRLTAAQKTA